MTICAFCKDHSVISMSSFRLLLPSSNNKPRLKLKLKLKPKPKRRSRLSQSLLPFQRLRSRTCSPMSLTRRSCQSSSLRETISARPPSLRASLQLNRQSRRLCASRSLPLMISRSSNPRRSQRLPSLPRSLSSKHLFRPSHSHRRLRSRIASTRSSKNSRSSEAARRTSARPSATVSPMMSAFLTSFSSKLIRAEISSATN
mmetsp:Transcript_33045/g.40915  ORF Transcript_33045/g.40915 Transcript_33045/m.40915 type:complete len:201 (+) Transcript_33045:3448-4050(+)